MNEHRMDEGWERDLAAGLREAAETITPADRLGAIRAAVRPQPRRLPRLLPHLVPAGLAVAATIVVAAVGAQQLLGRDHRTPAASHSAEPFGAIALPLYYATDTAAGPRLAREFHHGPDTDRFTAALAQLVGDPLDGDYDTLVPAGMVSAARIEPAPGSDTTAGAVSGAEQIVVELADASWTRRPVTMTRARARIAGLQVVYTVRGVHEQGRLPVSFTVAGAPVAKVLGVPVTELTSASDREALIPMNLSLPQTGDSIDANLVIRGRGLDLARGWTWTIRDAERQVVRSGSVAQPDAPGGYAPFETRLDVSGLAPGDYELSVRLDVETARPNLQTYADTKQFQIR